jgi:predicted ATPase/class 3 adenylate cyclase
VSGPLPTGTLTLLFSDIEGSTSLLRALGDDWAGALSAQRLILRAVFARHGGRELGTEGDSFFVVFPSAVDAVSAALEAQCGLVAHAWPPGGRIRVRMGLHTGEPTPHEDGYVGIDVHLAARVAAAAHGGQVVLTDATRQLVAGHLPDGAVVTELGRHRLKDFPQPVALVQVTTAGLDRWFPPLRTLGERAHLPPQATGIVGRDGELAELRQLLGGGCRLLTLTGPGGTGKTRLAVAVAEAVGDGFPDGVYFVSLETARTRDVLESTLAETLGLPADARSPSDLTRFLADLHLLLVLDNLEQLPEAGSAVEQLLAAAPRVAVVATSRRPLHVYGEHEHPVPPLTLPGRGGVERSGAVALFAERARLVRPGFTLTPDVADDVAEICRLLDGLPLAIELAAARTKLLSPRALRSRLAADLDVAVSHTTGPERHRTLRAAVAWSYGLLTPDQQRVFRTLGVFAGDFGLDAVQAVLDDDLDPLLAVEDLVDVSLAAVGEGVGGEPRVRLLRTIAVLARELLAAAGELETARRRHAEHHLAVVEEVAPQLRSGSYLSAKDRLEQELDNVRAALEWAVPETAPDGADPDRSAIGLRLCQALHWYWYAGGYQSEGRRWLARVVRAAGDMDSPELMAALHGLGVLLVQHGELEQGRDALRRSLEYWRRQGDDAQIARELSSLAVAHRGLGEPAVAREMLTESITRARRAGALERLAGALSNLAVMHVDEGRPAEALVLLEEALALDRDRGDTWGVVADHVNIAGALLEDGRPTEAVDLLSGVTATAAGLGDPDMSVALIEGFASAFGVLDDACRTARMVGAATALRDALELPIDPADAVVLEKWTAPVRDRTDPARWRADVEAGRSLGAEEALAEAAGTSP